MANIALSRSITGVEAVEHIARRISAILYGAAFLTERDGAHIWLLRTAGTTDFTDNWPVQQYNLEVGLQSVRRVVGRKVKPRALRLSSHVRKADLPSAWRELPISLSQRTMGMAFDLDELLAKANGVVLKSEAAGTNVDIQEADVYSMRACLETYLGRAAPECLSESMARAFGMSVRTYRRHLKRLGLSHRQLVSDARLSKAEAMLADPSISITEISFELGYANSPAFNVSSEPERDEHRRNLGQITCDSRFGRLNALDTIFAYAIQCTQ
ncbi:helix-turn-helix domain-containing protein [Ruegeria arenilitoris]|uniref:helix-turn-helix domain-containing protein n=1 Tax=Ruegeria arenilitoris TaxID=1173585 RepID=UPI001481BCDE